MATKKVKCNIGCSGFYYKDWKEIFYPAGMASNKWFSFYANHFNTIESNVTFYRLPTLTTLNKWYQQSPADFTFSVKVPRTITHYKKLINCGAGLTEFYSLAQNGLKDKLACILFQFPPSFSYTGERLSNIITSVDKSFCNIVEFRHESWWQQSIYQQLQQNNITFCNISHPKLPADFIKTFPAFYLRLHGVPELYKSSYSKEYLNKVVNHILQNKRITSVYIYFNNTIKATAVDNADYIKNIFLSQLNKKQDEI